MENEVNVISKSVMINVIRCLANMYGFSIREDVMSDWLPCITDEDVNVIFHQRFDFAEYRKTGVALTHFTVNVSVKRMGGDPTVEELRNTAERIKSAASFMELFNNKKYAVKEEE